MFVFVFAWLAQHQKRWVVLAAGTALAVAGIGIFGAGFSTHQPLISRIGVLLTIGAVAYAVMTIRARRSRVRREVVSGNQSDSHQILNQARQPEHRGTEADTELPRLT